MRAAHVARVVVAQQRRVDLVANGDARLLDFGMDSTHVILNETAVEAMNLEDPVGTTVRFYGAEKQVIGVVSDFHFESMHQAIKPAVMHLQKGEGAIVTRIKQEDQRETLAAIENLYKKYNPGAADRG